MYQKYINFCLLPLSSVVSDRRHHVDYLKNKSKYRSVNDIDVEQFVTPETSSPHGHLFVVVVVTTSANLVVPLSSATPSSKFHAFRVHHLFLLSIKND